MITSTPERIDQYVKQGLWENKTLHSLLGESRNRYPQMLAVADQPNRIELTGNKSTETILFGARSSQYKFGMRICKSWFNKG